jgi:hypothetical protein
VVPEPRS